MIPGRASVEIDGRTLPGQTDAAFLEELKDALGRDGNPGIEVIRSLPAVEASSKTPLFDHLASTLTRHDPTGFPLPYLIPGYTDAKAYAKLGTNCYGFAPVRFDPTHEVSFAAMYHGHDERVPVEGVHWGLRILYEAVVGFTG